MTTSPLRALSALTLATTLALAPASVALACQTPTTPADDTPVADDAAMASDTSDTATDPNLEAQLTQVRAATIRYEDVRLAEADGYTMGESCIPGLGYHFVRQVAEGQEQLDITEPNSLLYMPQEDGSLKLAAVTYVSKRAASLFGQEFTPPFTLPYYTLHVWVWEENPNGVFEHMNPNVTCPGGDARAPAES